jgi:hypothetical protein
VGIVPTMTGMRLFQAADVMELAGLSRSQLREWSSRDRRNLVPADVDPEGPGRHALYKWQTVLVLRLLRTLHTDFAVEVAAWAPGMNRLRQEMERVSFPSLWGSLVYFPNRDKPRLTTSDSVTSLGGVLLPLDPHLLIIATKLSLPPQNQLFLFPVVGVTR